MNKKILFKILPFSLMLFLFQTTIVYANHSHTKDCYAGSQHICSGDEINGGTCFNTPQYHTHLDTCYSLNCQGNNTKTNYEQNEELCPGCQQPLGVVTITCEFCKAENTSIGCHNRNCEFYIEDPTLQHGLLTIELAKIQNKLECGKDETTIEKWTKSCTKTNEKWYNSSGVEITPSCAYIVSNITPSYATQEGKNQIDMTINIQYLDGHSELKTASFNDFNGDHSIDQDVTLYWTGIGDAYGNQKQFSCKIKYTAYISPTPTPTFTPTPTPTTIPTQTIEDTNIINTSVPTTTVEPNNDTYVNNENNENINNGNTSSPIVVIDKELLEEQEEDNLKETTIDLETISDKEQKNKLVTVIIIAIVIVIILMISLNVYVLKKEEYEDYEEDDEDNEDNYK